MVKYSYALYTVLVFLMVGRLSKLELFRTLPVTCVASIMSCR